MAVTLLTQPDPFALTQGGRMAYSLQADARLITAGTVSQHWLYVQGPVPDGLRFTWRWASTSVELIARTNPTQPNEFPAGDGSAAYVDQLVEFFSTYYPFRKDFTASRGVASVFGQVMLLNAKKKGPAYSIISPVLADLKSGSTASGLAFLRLAGSDPQQRDRYGALVELWVKPTDAAEFTLLDSRHLEADPTGLCQYDAGTILHSFLTPDLPATSGPTTTLSTRSVTRYYLAYAEAWGQPLMPGKVLTSPVRTALRGGADYLHKANGGFPITPYFSGVMPVTDRALRPGGSLTRYVLPTEPQFLTFLNGRIDRADVSIEFGVTYDNGQSGQVRRSLGAWPIGSKLTLPVGVLQAGVGSMVPPGNHLREYSVRLVLTSDVGTALSQSYRYILNYAPQPHARFFLYQNSLGCPDTLTTFGKGSAELQIMAEQAERSLGTSYLVTDGQFVDYDVRLQQQIEVATGWRPAAELQRWLDFYRSAERYMWLATAAGLTAVPVSLISKSIRQAKDGDNALAHQFQVAISYADAYSWDDAGLLSDPTPPAGFQPTGTVQLTQTTIVPVVDATISQAVRDLTPADVLKFKQVAVRPDPISLGFLNQQAAEGLFPSRIETEAHQTATEAQLLTVSRSVVAQFRIRVRAVPANSLPQ